jgi:diacylglycerol kinase family enzyme
MGIPLQPQKALQTILEKHIAIVDVGAINEGNFFGVAGVGLDAEVAHAFQNFGKRGALPYYYIGLRVFKQFSYDPIKIIMDEKTIQTNPLLVTVANTQQYGNGAIIAPQADCTDGMLDICIVDRFPLKAAPHSLRQLFTGTVNKNPYYRSFKSKNVTIIQRKGKDRFHVDGEPRTGGQELRISVRPKALRVCVGRNY